MKKIDILYEQTKYEVIKIGKASSSYIERKMGINYKKAVYMMDRLEKDSIIKKSKGTKPWKVLITPIEGRKNECLEDMGSEYEDLYKKAKDLSKELGKVTRSVFEKHFLLGYARSSMLVEMLTVRGVIDKTGKYI